jgi:hypothetical protein
MYLQKISLETGERFSEVIKKKVKESYPCNRPWRLIGL